MKIIAADFETDPIAPGNQLPRAIVTSWCDGTPAVLTHCNPFDRPTSTARLTWEAVLRGALKRDARIVGHNLPFDLGVAAANWPELLETIFQVLAMDGAVCTSMRERLINIGKLGGHWQYTKKGKITKAVYDLGAVSRVRRLSKQADKDDPWRLRYNELWDVPIEYWPVDARDYSQDDAAITWELYHDQEREDPRYLVDQYNQTRKGWWLQLMSAWGIMTDRDAVNRFAETIRVQHDELEAELIAGGFVSSKLQRKNKDGVITYARPRKEKVTREYAGQLVAATGVEPLLTEKGAISLSEEACKRIDEAAEAKFGDAYPGWLGKYAEFSTLKKIVSTDIPMLLLGADGTPIHSRFMTPAETGRTTSSKPNIQNVSNTEGIRECFTARPGYIYAGADFTGLELGTVSEVCYNVVGWSSLGDALNAGKDPHAMMAAQLGHSTYEVVMEALSGRMGPEAKKWAKGLRQLAKVANFGFPGGLGARTLVAFARGYKLKITEDEARDLKRQWLIQWPEFRHYFAWVNAQFGGSETAIMTQLYSNRIRGNCYYTKACNTMFQGLGGDATGAAGFLLAWACYVRTPCRKCAGRGCAYCQHSPGGPGCSPLYGSRPCNYIHDEFIMETPDTPNRSPAALELSAVMVEGAAPWMPHVCPQAEPVLMYQWNKNAESVWRDGELQPWHPGTQKS